MADDIIYDTDFYTTLETAVEDFTKALTKRWRERVATAIDDLQSDFPVSFHRYQAPYGETTWPYWDTLNQFHFMYGECDVVTWAKGDQKSDVPEGCLGRTYGPGNMYPKTTTDTSGNEVTVPQEIDCGLDTIMKSVEHWAYGEGSAILGALPKFDAHDQHLIEDAQKSLLKIGAQLGLSAAEGSDMEFDFAGASNGDLVADANKLAGADGADPLWYQHWTGLSADSLKDGFFSSINPTFTNQGKIAGGISNLYAARGTIIQQGRAGDLDLLIKATKALDATQEITTSYNAVWQAFQGVGTALTIPGAFFPPVGAVGASISLIGIAGANFLPQIKTVEYANSVEDVMEKVWTLIEEHKTALFYLENDYDNGVHSLRNAVYGVHSFNLELYDLTENSAAGNGSKVDGYQADVDEILELADTCFEAAGAYEDGLIPLIAVVQSADPALADESGSAGYADPKVIGLVEEFYGYLTTACGRLYEAGEQIKAAAEAYAHTDEEQQALFDGAMENWDEGPAPAHADEWAKDTDRSGWDPNKGDPYREGSTSPGNNDEGAENYETELSGE